MSRCSPDSHLPATRRAIRSRTITTIATTAGTGITGTGSAAGALEGWWCAGGWQEWDSGLFGRRRANSNRCLLGRGA